MITRTRAHLIWVILPLVVVSLPGRSSAQTHSHSHEDEAHHGRALHFSHPIFTESVTPDTDFRLSFGGERLGGGWSSQVGIGAEYAFHRAFSVEVQLPYLAGPGIGETHMGLKFASHAFEDSGVLLGYGVEFGLPTGAGAEPTAQAGHDEAEESSHPHAEQHSGVSEVEPFVSVGWMTGRWELQGFATFGLPTGSGHAVETGAGSRVSMAASALYHVSDRVQALLEYDSQSWIVGAGPRVGLAQLSPGLKVQPLADLPLLLAVGASLPTPDQGHSDTRMRMSVFYHF